MLNLFVLISLYSSASWGIEFSCLNTYASTAHSPIKASDFLSILNNRKKLDINEIRTPDAAFAFLEAVSSKEGIGIVNFKNLMSKGSAQKTKVASLVFKISNDQKLNRTTLKAILFEIYLLSRMTQLGIVEQSWFQKKLKSAEFKESLRQKVESEIFIDDVVTAVENVATLPESRFIYKLTSAASSHSVTSETSYTLALNFLTLKFLGSVGYLPGIWERLSDRLHSTIRNEIRSGNYSAQQKNIESQTRIGHGLQSLWKIVRLTYSTAFVLQTAAVLVPAAPALEATLASFTVHPTVAAAHQEKNFSADKVRRDQFQSWRQAFYNSEKRWPEPVRDAQEWKETYDSIYGTSSEDLKARY